MTTEATPNSETPPAPARRFRMALRAVQVRLRFVAILAVACVVAGQWETLANQWDRLTRGLAGGDGPVHAVSTDTEYFCPMDPGVVSQWPAKCGICNMALVRRKIGDNGPLPSGVLARMQFSPYRVQLAGIHTTPVAYEPLARTVTRSGSVQDDRLVDCELFPRDRALVVEGAAADVTPDDSPASAPLPGKVVRIAAPAHGRPLRAVVRLDDADQALPPGTPVRVTIRRPVAELEPFWSLPAGAPPRREGDRLAVYVCPEHRDVHAEQRGRCPVDGQHELQRQPLRENQRVAWWCPMHPNVTAERAGANCRACGGMKLVPRVVTYRPPGQVLAVPESAVVDTGTRTIVFVESMPGTFDGLEVVLGPRCGDVYPVAKGLEPGQRIVTAGAFLIDAETRLNPSLAASYFGATSAARSEPPRPDAGADLSRLSPEDRALAAAQKTCPVTGKPLGSMGPPVRIDVAGRTLLICCEECAARLRKTPEKYLPEAP